MAERERARALLEARLKEYGLPFSLEIFWDRLWWYLKALVQAGPTLNLTAHSSPEEYLDSAVLEALILASVIPSGPLRLADLGSGGGIPGMVLKLVRPDLEVTLFEAFAPRTIFLEEIIAELSLSGIRVRQCHLGSEWPEERFSVVVSRGYGSVAKFTRHARALLSPPAMAFYLWRKEVEPRGSEWELPLEAVFRLELPRGPRPLLFFRFL